MNTENVHLERPEYRLETPREESAWRSFREQIPAIIVTVVLVSVAAAWIFGRSASKEEAALAPLREQNEALRAQADQNRQEIEATSQMLRGAISRHEGDLFKTDEEIQRMNGDRINSLADAIAQKVAPALPARQTPEQLAQAEDEQVEKISTRTADKLRPALGELSQKQQGLNEQVVSDYNNRIQQLNTKVQRTQAAAQDALKLSHEVSTLYLNSFQDQGALVRIFALPGEIIQDAAHGNIINHSPDKEQRELDRKMQEIEQRLDQIQAQNAAASAPLAKD